MALATEAVAVVVEEEAPRSPSAVSWAAIIGGALTAVAVTLLLVALGTGIGLSSVSPWSPANPSATTFTLLAAVWLIIVQWLSSGLGGYLSGRLRTKWAGLHTDEVFFRDTAHGFLAWALATVLVAAFATSSISSAVGTATQAVSNVASGATSGATQAAANQSPVSTDYFLDTLFRRDQPDANASPQDARAEAGRILARSIANGNLDPADRTYLARLIAARTGISQQDAEKRIDDTIESDEGGSGQGEGGSRCRAQGLGKSLLLSVLLDADRCLHRLRRRRNRRPATRSLKTRRRHASGIAKASDGARRADPEPARGLEFGDGDAAGSRIYEQGL